MDANDFTLRGRLQAERIVVPEILLGGEGKLHDIIDGADVIGGEVHFLQLMAVERDVVIHILHNLVEAFALERAHFIAAHALFVGIPDHI